MPAPHPGSDSGHLDVVWWAAKAACVQSSWKPAAGSGAQRAAGAHECDSGRWGLLPTSHPAWSRWWGHRVLSPVPARLSEERPPLLPLCPSTAQRLTRQHLKAPDVRGIGPRAGTEQCVPKKGCSWVLAKKWGPGSQKGISSEFLSSAPNFKPPTGPGPEAGAEAW